MEKGRGKEKDTLQTDNGFAHKKYIEREAAIAFMNEVEPCICHDPDGAVFTATKDSNMLEFLRAIPAADVVPVRHGRWVFNDELDDMFHCTVCDNVAVRNTFNYCPNCGARMDGDSE